MGKEEEEEEEKQTCIYWCMLHWLWRIHYKYNTPSRTPYSAYFV
jgi:hypothetical protein